MDGTSKKQKKKNHELPAKKCSEVRQSTLSAPPSPLRCINGYQQVVWEAQQIFFFWGGGEVGRRVRWVGEGGIDDTETVDMRWY